TFMAGVAMMILMKIFGLVVLRLQFCPLSVLLCVHRDVFVSFDCTLYLPSDWSANQR
ncbi:hypothetical protein L9F63_028281, partial [Diploptera punctata]